MRLHITPAAECRSVHRRRFASCGFMFVFLILVLAGCSSNLSTVKGKITLAGKPLTGAFVEFTPQVEGGSTSYGRTDASGNYYLMFSLNKVGAVPGENVVRITTADIGDVGVANVKERVPNRYNRKTELRVEVKAHQANVCNFDLESDGGKVVQPKFDS